MGHVLPVLSELGILTTMLGIGAADINKLKAAGYFTVAVTYITHFDTWPALLTSWSHVYLLPERIWQESKVSANRKLKRSRRRRQSVL